MKRTIATAAMLIAVGGALAGIPFGTAFAKKYSPKKDSNLVKAKCALCHTKGVKLNPYGTDLNAALKGDKKPSDATFTAVEKLDSDKDGVSNIDEIKKDTLPGDAKSK